MQIMDTNVSVYFGFNSMLSPGFKYIPYDDNELKKYIKIVFKYLKHDKLNNKWEMISESEGVKCPQDEFL